MKKFMCVLMIVVCIILCAWLVGAKYTEYKLNQDENNVVLMDGERTQEERKDKQGEIIKSWLKEDLESRKEIANVSIDSEFYEKSLESEVVEIKVTLQEGYSMNRKLEEEIQSYVLTATNCKQVIVTVE